MTIMHVTLATRDLERTSQFYQATMLWQPIVRPQNIPMSAAWLAISEHQELHILEDADFAPSPFEREYGRHFAVSYPQSGFADLKQRLAQHDAELIDPLRETPVERFFFKDPNGYVIEVIAAPNES